MSLRAALTGSLILLAVMALAQAPKDPPKHVVFYAGGRGNERFTSIVQLSDGTLLVGGVADGLAWVPKGTPTTQLPATGINNALGAGKQGKGDLPLVAFILHLSADLSKVLRVVALPPGGAEDIRWIRFTTPPGQPTGTIYLSGATVDSKANGGGFFIGRLDHNFLDGVPTKFVWVRNIAGYSKQPWDVGGDGKVVYIGDGFSLQRLTANGEDDIVPEFRHHILKNGEQFYGYAKDCKAEIAYSKVSIKPSVPDLRSWTFDDYFAIVPDGIGHTKVGRWPMDYYARGPASPNGDGPSFGGPGYTGYRATGATGIGFCTVDKRTNHFYIGYNNQTKLPDGLPDFEPGVAAFSDTGALKWWSRLYRETMGNSTPDQYVDCVAIDYSKPADKAEMMVIGRCHGNNVENLFSGSHVSKALVPDAAGVGFKNGFSGINSNIHLSWLGKFRQADGTLTGATYVAEWIDPMTGTGGPSRDPLLDGFPDPNGGWAELNTTGTKPDLRTDEFGRVYLLGRGRRTLTTSNAFQKMIKLKDGTSCWNDFIRVYQPRLNKVAYSSILTGKWDPMGGDGGNNITLSGVCPVKDGVIVVGWQERDAATGAPRGNPMPTANIPTWGRPAPSGEEAVIAKMVFDTPVQ